MTFTYISAGIFNGSKGTVVGIALHKMQGSTAKHGAVIQPSIGRPFSRGLDYVAPSRSTELNNLFLLRRLSEENFNGFKTEITDINNEYNRLRQLNNLLGDELYL